MKDTFSEGKKKGGENKFGFLFQRKIKGIQQKKRDLKARKLKFSLTLYKIKR